MKLEDFMTGPLPGDLTLGELKIAALHDPALRELSEQLPHGRKLRVRFVQLLGSKWIECADDTTLAEFQAWSRIGKAKIQVDDLGGGLKVEEPA